MANATLIMNDKEELVFDLVYIESSRFSAELLRLIRKSLTKQISTMYSENIYSYVFQNVYLGITIDVRDQIKTKFRY